RPPPRVRTARPLRLAARHSRDGAQLRGNQFTQRPQVPFPGQLSRGALLMQHVARSQQLAYLTRLEGPHGQHPIPEIGESSNTAFVRYSPVSPDRHGMAVGEMEEREVWSFDPVAGHRSPSDLVKLLSTIVFSYSQMFRL